MIPKKINKKNSLDLKGTKVIKNSRTLNLNNIFHVRLTKNNSSIFTNNSILNNISKFTMNESLTTIDERINNNFIREQIKKRPKKIVINGFKKTLITLTKKKINDIKNLYPTIDTKIKPSLQSNIEFKEKGNHNDNYIKHLGNLIPYVKIPSPLTNRELSQLNLMTGKKYTRRDLRNNGSDINEINKDL